MKKKSTTPLIMIEDILVSGEVADEMFACDIAKCKGECCVAGDLGAPLEKSELKILEEVYPEVEPYMSEDGKIEIATQGHYVYDMSNGYSTPLMEKTGACAYVIFDDKGVALCAIEKAFLEGKISFQKPISCHLYPIRVTKNKTMEALNYDRWDICGAACIKGKAQGIPVYQFAKQALVRKYGESFFEALEGAILYHSQQNS